MVKARWRCINGKGNDEIYEAKVIKIRDDGFGDKDFCVRWRDEETSVLKPEEIKGLPIP